MFVPTTVLITGLARSSNQTTPRVVLEGQNDAACVRMDGRGVVARSSMNVEELLFRERAADTEIALMTGPQALPTAVAVPMIGRARYVRPIFHINVQQVQRTKHARHPATVSV